MSKITREELNKAQQHKEDSASAYLKMKKEFAIQECPLSIGDVTPCVGWSHKGKKMRITSIKPPKYSFDGDWRACGVVLKKDGEDSKMNSDFSHRDYNNKTGRAKDIEE